MSEATATAGSTAQAVADSGARDAAARAMTAARQHWQAVHDRGDIQFAPLPPFKAAPTPGWLEPLGRFLKAVFEPVARALGVSWPVLEKILIVAVAIGALALVWQIGMALYARWQGRQPRAAEADWAPAPQQAQALLAEADRLAGEGRYDEATHLLLLRSVDHIATARPDWLHPASTAREIAGLTMLPTQARETFATIAGLVETSRYALRPLAAPDWSVARQAYAAFAVQRIGAAQIGATR